MGKIVAVCTSANKGERKKNVGSALFIKDQGLEGDAHVGFAHRQVSLLALESIKKMQDKGFDVYPGDFAENLTTEGLDLVSLPVGTRLKAGKEVYLRVTQIGKECHSRCAIYQQAGDCVMPREGIFTEVLRGGKVSTGDPIDIYPACRFAVITVSDRGAAGLREDRSGPLLAEMLLPWGDVAEYHIIPDEKEPLAKMLRSLADQNRAEVVFTTGGTGVSPRDVTPEATRQVIEKEVPGIPEAMRLESLKITPKAMLSRAVAGIRGRTLIINLPGSPKAVRENLAVFLPALDHALEVLTGRCGECASPE
ncbi:MAG: molybdopterin-binding protein [Peptococcaceae bacterium]|jgi:molybdenum cofactor synthesis domain-containing protein|nr:molybdopterin-binding protein [Peptococcaceae bacterium]MDH7524416.1 molybdopterin-binding protein [Peptococcaceae bacterium]